MLCWRRACYMIVDDKMMVHTEVTHDGSIDIDIRVDNTCGCGKLPCH